MEKETYVESDGLEYCSFCRKPREKSLKGGGKISETGSTCLV